jgi:recombination protein RecA
MTIESVIARINKKHGENVVRTMTGTAVKWRSIPTGILSLDYATGTGGIPRGRISQIYGAESSGKTSICLSTIAQAQRNGEICAFIDAENTVEQRFAEQMGVDWSKLIYSQPSHGEEGLQVTADLCATKEVGLIVVDSVPTLVPKGEMEGELYDSNMGLASRMMARGMRRIVPEATQSNTAVVFVNQIRANIATFSFNPITLPGGHALRHACTLMVEVKQAKVVKRGDVKIGADHLFNITKNKLFQKANGGYKVIWGVGADSDAQIVELALDAGILTKNGNKIFFEGEVLGSSLAKTQEHVAENLDLAETLKTLLRGGL